MGKSVLALSEVYRVLEPGPVVLLATAWKGRPNVMTMSWYLPMEFEPPLIGAIISDRDYSFEALTHARECTINVPTYEMARAVVGCGNTSGRKIDKFERFGLTALPATKVSAPLIDECFAGFECLVEDTRLVKKYCFFVLRVVAARMDRRQKNPVTMHHEGRGRFMLAGRRVQLKSKMK